MSTSTDSDHDQPRVGALEPEVFQDRDRFLSRFVWSIVLDPPRLAQRGRDSLLTPRAMTKAWRVRRP